jgi:pyruvate/2-oxoglutarate/acetoin dehydrogenase E1 component
VTLGLQDKYGIERVFDTSLNEEGIIGRAVGMALAGLMPVPEIQFRKYAEPATEQINDCGTMRWRTNNRFAAPMVLRIPGGFFKVGDPLAQPDQRGAVRAQSGLAGGGAVQREDAVGLLRAGLRGNDPVIFFEHRAMLDDAGRAGLSGRRLCAAVRPGEEDAEGDQITIVTWGAMVPRCEEAAAHVSADVIDLRTLVPWDREMVLESVRRTRRCLIVHEDLKSGGFGARSRRWSRTRRSSTGRTRRAGDNAGHSEPHTRLCSIGRCRASKRSAPGSTIWWVSDAKPSLRGAERRSNPAGGRNGTGSLRSARHDEECTVIDVIVRSSRRAPRPSSAPG